MRPKRLRRRASLGGRRLLAAWICCGVLAACAPAARSRTPSVPRRITAKWYVATFPNCIDYCDDRARDSVWIAVRGRPEMADALIQVIESRRTDRWTRAWEITPHRARP